AAVSMEIHEKQLHMVVTKPVHPIQIWLGKWLGLLVINGVLLIFSGIVIYSLMKFNLRTSKLTADDQHMLKQELLVARETIPFRAKDFEEEARKRAERRMNSPDLPQNVTFKTVLDDERRLLIQRSNSVSDGEKRQWVFDLPDHIDQTLPVLVRFRFNASSIGSDKIQGTFRIKTDNHPEPWVVATSNAPKHLHSFVLPEDIPEGARRLMLEYSNDNPTPVTVIFNEDDGLLLLAYHSRFEANLARALFMIFIQLAFVGAIGLTAGTLFSMPVAALASVYVILLFSSSGYLQKNVEGENIVSFEPGQAAPWFEGFLKALFNLIYFFVKPLQTVNYTELLALGRLIPTAAILGAVIFKLFIYSGVMAALSAYSLRKREVALPTQ
ncbi:MAG: hypothetical protein AAF492_05595, partial [Verrucomicrobiota bacterium]